MAVACLIVFTAQMATTIYLPSLPMVERDFAGVAATFAALLHENVVWASVATVLSLTAFLLVRVRVRE
ncbi:hypothetical protein CVV72_15125 [Amycolatopsis sp. TNS106]|nr:hypothetical protein CVV72_15125 [Amycolatopsis sp. TNS106]